MYKGEAEYDTIRAVKKAISIPVIANGDIRTPQQAKEVLAYTDADAIMIGRGAQGNPWLFREISHYLETGEELAPPPIAEVAETTIKHVEQLHSFYGSFQGVRIARKHVGWYLKEQASNDEFRQVFNRLEDASEQLQALEDYFVTVEKR